MLGRIALFSWIIALAAAVRPEAARSTPAARPRGPVAIFAAASLGPPMREMERAFERSHPGTDVRPLFGASSALRAQIEQGAPADVFASADWAQMEALRRAGLVLAARRLAKNRLALVVPASNPARIRSAADLARPGLRLVGAAPEVPVGRYTRQALERLARAPGYPRDFAERVEGNFRSREPNVRAILAKVELGEADAAFVYETDARGSRRVRTVPLPPAAQLIAEYPIAVLAHAPNRAGAEAFVRFALSPAGQAILRRYGFR